MDSLVRILHTPEETEHEARRFIEALRPDTTSATLITLSGELGTGKTSFAQSVAKALGVEDVVNSPTFVIEKIYAIPQEAPGATTQGQLAESTPASRFARLIHIDAYRLQSAGDLTALGFGEIMSHPGTLILLEWPERVTGIAEQAAVRILLEHLPDGTRQITYA